MQRQGIGKVEPGHGLGVGDSRQVHNPVLLQQRVAEAAQPVQPSVVQGQLQPGQSFDQRRSHARSFTIRARKDMGASVWLRMAWVWPSAQNSASPAWSS